MVGRTVVFSSLSFINLLNDVVDDAELLLGADNEGEDISLLVADGT